VFGCEWLEVPTEAKARQHAATGGTVTEALEENIYPSSCGFLRKARMTWKARHDRSSSESCSGTEKGGVLKISSAWDKGNEKARLGAIVTWQTSG
jgi:hypothetical protein